MRMLLTSKIKEARLALEAGDLRAARAVYEGLPAELPECRGKALYWLGWSRMEEGEGLLQEAAELLSKGLALCRCDEWEHDCLTQGATQFAKRMATSSSSSSSSSASSHGQSAAASAKALVEKAVQEEEEQEEGKDGQDRGEQTAAAVSPGPKAKAVPSPAPGKSPAARRLDDTLARARGLQDSLRDVSDGPAPRTPRQVPQSVAEGAQANGPSSGAAKVPGGEEKEDE